MTISTHSPFIPSENASILSQNNIHLITVTLKIEQLVDLIQGMSKLFIVIYFLEEK